MQANLFEQSCFPVCRSCRWAAAAAGPSPWPAGTAAFASCLPLSKQVSSSALRTPPTSPLFARQAQWLASAGSTAPHPQLGVLPLGAGTDQPWPNSNPAATAPPPCLAAPTHAGHNQCFEAPTDGIPTCVVFVNDSHDPQRRWGLASCRSPRRCALPALRKSITCERGFARRRQLRGRQHLQSACTYPAGTPGSKSCWWAATAGTLHSSLSTAPRLRRGSPSPPRATPAPPVARLDSAAACAPAPPACWRRSARSSWTLAPAWGALGRGRAVVAAPVACWRLCVRCTAVTTTARCACLFVTCW